MEPSTCPTCHSDHVALPGPNFGACNDDPWHDQGSVWTRDELAEFAEAWHAAAGGPCL